MTRVTEGSNDEALSYPAALLSWKIVIYEYLSYEKDSVSTGQIFAESESNPVYCEITTELI